MFSLREHVLQQVNAYIALFPSEKPQLRALIAQLQGGGDVFDRSNMVGHITTSSLVYDDKADKVLVIHHLLFDRELQPGGHQEGNGPLSDSAERETVEETGAESSLHPWHAHNGAPLDIDTHPIPAQPKKNEGEHVHHDFIYLFTGDSTKPLVAQLEEVKHAKWISRSAFTALPGERFKRLGRKLELASC